MKPWKRAQHPVIVAVVPRCFNGATAMKPWKRVPPGIDRMAGIGASMGPRR